MTQSQRGREWSQSHGPDGIEDLDRFFRGVAEARYVMRRVVRIVDEHAGRHALEPLQHQLLIQLFGASDKTLYVNRLAERLDVPAAVASRLAKALEERALVERTKSEKDRRITNVSLTPEGSALCVRIWESVRPHLEFFQSELGDEAKRIALAVFSFYVGLTFDFAEVAPE